jgi:hypothetical protein
MGLSKRERVIALITVVVVGGLLADRLIVTPGLRQLTQTKNQKQELLAELTEARNLFERRRLLERKWKTMLSDGLRNDAEAESRVARALDEWSQDTRLTLTSVKPDRVAGDKGLKEMTFVVAGRGQLGSVAQFLYKAETAELPIKIKDMQLGSTSESGDSMSLQLRLSTLYLGAEEKSSNKQAQTKQAETNNEEQLLQ